MMNFKIILILVLFFVFSSISVAHEKESKVEVETVVVKELVFVSENGTRVTIVLGDDGRFYIVAMTNPSEEPKE